MCCAQIQACEAQTWMVGHEHYTMGGHDVRMQPFDQDPLLLMHIVQRVHVINEGVQF